MTQDSPGRYSFTNVPEENLATDNEPLEVVFIEEETAGEDEPTIEIVRSEKPVVQASSAKATLPIGKHYFPK